MHKVELPIVVPKPRKRGSNLLQEDGKGPTEVQSPQGEGQAPSYILQRVC